MKTKKTFKKYEGLKAKLKIRTGKNEFLKNILFVLKNVVVGTTNDVFP